MRRLLFILLLGMSVAAHAIDAASVGAKAARAFQAGDWPSAHALYMMLSDAEPRRPQPYGRAIVASLMRGDTTATASEVERALSHGVKLDSVLTVVETDLLALGKGNMYVAELHRIGKALPYLRRPMDIRLLDYYTFRCDAPNIIRYSRLLLAGLPDSATYLNSLANGYVLAGDMEHAVATWRHVIELHPDNLEALVSLGNALAETAPQQALPYLKKAYSLHPTPYLESLISSLENTDN